MEMGIDSLQARIRRTVLLRLGGNADNVMNNFVLILYRLSAAKASRPERVIKSGGIRIYPCRSISKVRKWYMSWLTILFEAVLVAEERPLYAQPVTTNGSGDRDEDSRYKMGARTSCTLDTRAVTPLSLDTLHISPSTLCRGSNPTSLEEKREEKGVKGRQKSKTVEISLYCRLGDGLASTVRRTAFDLDHLSLVAERIVYCKKNRGEESGLLSPALCMAL